MLTHAVTDSRAWTATSIDDRACWYYSLPDVCLAILDQIKREPQPFPAITTIFLSNSQRAICGKTLEPVRHVLETGRGFAIIDAPTGERLSSLDAQLLYWIIGQGLGESAMQNVQGTLLYDVRDTGQELTKGARFSVTNYESSFHTDASFCTEIVNYVGLLCLQTAKTGGRSQLLSGYALHNELLARHPNVLATLYQPFHIDRRGGVREGEEPTIAFPIINWNTEELLYRYLRYWIEAGHGKISQPLTPSQLAALNVLDEEMRRQDLRVEFDLKPGQMYFINNRWILHNRTAFEDHPEPELRRHLVRLWLR